MLLRHTSIIHRPSPHSPHVASTHQLNVSTAAAPCRPPPLALAAQRRRNSRGATALVARASRRQQRSSSSSKQGPQSDEAAAADSESVDEPPPVIDVARKAEAICASLPGLHPNHVRSLVQQHAALALLPLDKLVRGLPPLAHALGVPLRQALHMAARQPAVLDRELAKIVGACVALADAVELPVEQAMFIAARQPLLLECQPTRLVLEAAKVAGALGCSTRGGLLLLSRLDGPQLQLVLAMSASTLQQRLPELVDALGLPSDSTRGLDPLAWVARHPPLLAAPPGAVGRSTDALLVAFQFSTPGAFSAVLSKCPSLLTYPAEQLLANYQGLLLALQVSRHTAARMLQKHPQLLRCTPDTLSLKLRAMAFQMHLPQAQVVSMCVRQPALLSCDSAQLQARLEHLQALMGGTYQAAVLAVARCPSLLLRTTRLVDAKYALLLQATELPPARLGMLLLQQPSLLTLSLGHLQGAVQGLQQLLQVQPAEPEQQQQPPLEQPQEHEVVVLWRPPKVPQQQQLPDEQQLPEEQQPAQQQQPETQQQPAQQQQPGSNTAVLGQVLLQIPDVLLRGQHWMQEQGEQLQEFLALPPGMVAQLLQRCPKVLTAGSPVWLANLSTLLDVVQASPAQVQKAVLAEPRLLQLQPAEFRLQVAQTMQLLHQAGAWQQQLGGLTCGQLLQLLRIREQGHLRLLYLLQSSRAGSLGHAAAAAVDAKAFSRKHPGFKRWLKQVPRDVLASLAASAAAAAASAQGGAQEPWHQQQEAEAGGNSSTQLNEQQDAQQVPSEQPSQQPPAAFPLRPSGALLPQSSSSQEQLQQRQREAQRRRQQPMPQQLMSPPIYRPMQQQQQQPTVEPQRAAAGSTATDAGSRQPQLQEVPAR